MYNEEDCFLDEKEQIEELDLASPSQKKKQHRAVWTKDKVQVLLDAYRYEKGNWESILKNKRILELGYDKTQLQNKIKTISSKRLKKTFNESGTKKRESIVKNLRDDTDKDEELLQKRRREFISQPLTEEEKVIEEVENEQTSEAVDSSQITSVEDFKEYEEEEQARRKKQRLNFQNITNQKVQAIQAIHKEQEQNELEKTANRLKESTLLQTLEVNQIMLSELFKNIREERSQPKDAFKEEIEKVKKDHEQLMLKLSRIEELLQKRKE